MALLALSFQSVAAILFSVWDAYEELPRSSCIIDIRGLAYSLLYSSDNSHQSSGDIS